MISGNKKSFKSDEIRIGRRGYYLLIKDNNPIGICLDMEDARKYLNKYIEKGAKELDEDICVYTDTSGKHIVSIKTVNRIKIK